MSYLLLDQLKMDWRILIGLLVLPSIIYGLMFWKLEFPQTERVQKGVSTSEMFSSCLNPLYLIMIACMFLTAATELGTGTWIGALLSGAGVSGILVLVFINGIMALGRSFAGPVVHRLNPNGMLIFSALLQELDYCCSARQADMLLLALRWYLLLEFVSFGQPCWALFQNTCQKPERLVCRLWAEPECFLQH